MITPPKDKAERDERLRLVLKTIEENPRHWDQTTWHCETSHCFAGFAQCIALKLNFAEPLNHCDEEGEFIDESVVVVDGMERCVIKDSQQFCGLTLDQRRKLFDPSNSFADLRRIVSEIIETPYEAAPA